ncbi:MAG: hypothetical protein ACREXJ_00170 [Gammaproteobacteria bacterium]
MPGLPIFVAVDGAQKYRELSKRLKAAGPEGKGLRRELNKAIRQAGRPAVADAKAAVLALSVQGTRGSGRRQRADFASARAATEAGKLAIYRRSGLRGAVAGATRVRTTSVGVKIVVDGKKLPPDQRTLPRHLDRAKGWRHPVFGNRDVWVGQRGGPWFFATLRRHAPAFRRAIVTAMNDIERRITR